MSVPLTRRKQTYTEYPQPVTENTGSIAETVFAGGQTMNKLKKKFG
jgi:hypothetical protein